MRNRIVSTMLAGTFALAASATPAAFAVDAHGSHEKSKDKAAMEAAPDKSMEAHHAKSHDKSMEAYNDKSEDNSVVKSVKSTVEATADDASRALSDAWMDGSLETALLFNEHLNSFSIDTEVKNGVAYLSGAVASDVDRDLAGEIAQSIDGVKDVENNLTVNKKKAAAARDSKDAKRGEGFKQAVNDATMTARIKAELLANTNTAGLSIDVDTAPNAVTLSGEVDSEQEKALAGQIAANAANGRSVNNQLKVATES